MGPTGNAGWCLAYPRIIHLLGSTEGEEVSNKASILGALTLYLDFVNLFLFLLRLFGRRR